ncbi:endonuclease/exonuclease/phosphatase family protein [Aliidiomarina sp. Khilg15.8]
MIFNTLLVLTLLLVLCTCLPIWRLEAWWVRVLDFPRLQLLVFAVLLVAASLLLLDFRFYVSWVMMAVIAGCALYQAWWVLPYSKLHPIEVKKATPGEDDGVITIMNANVLTPNRQAAKLIKLVRKHKPHILVTLESDSWWEKQLDTLEDTYTYSIKCPQDNLYGMHVYSRLPLSEVSIDYLVEKDVPSMHANAELESGRKVFLHFIHPAPPSPTENDESSERDAELVLVAKHVVKDDVPIIISGDLNDVAWSETTRLFRKISQLLDPRIGRGMFNSFHADHWFARWPLDHIFHSDHFTYVDMKRLPPIGSDHFPIMTTLALQPEHQDQQDAIQPDVDDKELAQEKLKDENVEKSGLALH